MSAEHIPITCATCDPPRMVYVPAHWQISQPYLCTLCQKRAQRRIENATEPWVGRVRHGEIVVSAKGEKASRASSIPASQTSLRLLMNQPTNPSSKEVEPALEPCPLAGHVPQGSSATFGPGPYVAESGDPDATRYYSVVCPGCCSTAHSRSREGIIKRWNTRVDSAGAMVDLQRRLYEECVTASWDPERKNTFAEEIAHLHEELSEAFRAWRRYKDCEIREVNGKLEGVPIEFADALIGMFYNAELYGFDLLAAIERKHQFNLTRNYVAEGRQLHEPESVASPAVPKDEAAGWRDIESAPRDGRTILVVANKLDAVSVRWMISDTKSAPDGAWFVGGYNGYRLRWEPTHWMPLPAPPVTKP